MTVNIGIILGTVRHPSLGGKLLAYLQKTYQDSPAVHYTWIDLHDYPLPLYDHPETPLSQPLQHLAPGEQAWLDVLKVQDGYLIISPEYDHAMTGALKNALDYVGPEVANKPVQIITYSHYSDGGVLAAESMVNVLRMLKMLVLHTPVLLWDCDNNFTDNGQLDASQPNSAHFARRLAEAFHDVTFYARVLKNNPYVPLTK